MGGAVDMLGGIDIGGIVIIAILVIGGLTAWYVIKGISRARIKENLEILKITQEYQKEKEAEDRKQGKDIVASVLGTGNFNCMCYRPGHILDWATIPKPIGEIYQADTSCPISGGIYIVKQLDNGEVVDYDPREVPVILEETPEYAWFATHWSIVKRVFSITPQWWKSTSLWFAAAMLVIMFIFGMATLGG